MNTTNQRKEFIESILTKQEISTLVKMSMEAANTARAPYSNFFVGSSILTDAGDYYMGANVETMTMNYTIHAEVCAVGKAVHDGKKKLKALACYATTKGYDYFITCCGECRNFLANYNSFLPIIYVHKSGALMYGLLHELLPYSYSPSDLAITNHEDKAARYGFALAKANKWMLEDTCWESRKFLKELMSEWKFEELYEHVKKNIELTQEGALEGKFDGGSN